MQGEKKNEFLSPSFLCIGKFKHIQIPLNLSQISREKTERRLYKIKATQSERDSLKSELYLTLESLSLVKEKKTINRHRSFLPRTLRSGSTRERRSRRDSRASSNSFCYFPSSKAKSLFFFFFLKKKKK